MPLRWVGILFFVTSSVLNYLDRQLLSVVTANLEQEFQTSLAQYGELIAAFSVAYGIAAPAMGFVVDRLGLHRGAALMVGTWSLATMAIGWADSMAAILALRFLLGIAQGGGVPAVGKANATYLAPSERALGHATSQIGISVGSLLAPLVAAFFIARGSWREAFLFAGAMGLLWIPMWFFVKRYIPVQPTAVEEAGGAAGKKESGGLREIIRQPAYWGIVLATMFGMVVYSLWMNFTSVYLVKVWQLPPETVLRNFAWIPPMVGGFGGVFGGSLALWLTRRGMPLRQVRLRLCTFGALLLLLLTAGVPQVPGPMWASLCIAASFLAATFFSVNLYSLPLDLFPHRHAAFAISSLTGAYGLMQAVVSPLVGWAASAYGFPVVCYAAAVCPLVSVAILRATAGSADAGKVVVGNGEGRG